MTGLTDFPLFCVSPFVWSAPELSEESSWSREMVSCSDSLCLRVSMGKLEADPLILHFADLLELQLRVQEQLPLTTLLPDLFPASLYSDGAVYQSAAAASKHPTLSDWETSRRFALGDKFTITLETSMAFSVQGL